MLRSETVSIMLPFPPPFLPICPLYTEHTDWSSKASDLYSGSDLGLDTDYSERFVVLLCYNTLKFTNSSSQIFSSMRLSYHSTLHNNCSSYSDTKESTIHPSALFSISNIRSRLGSYRVKWTLFDSVPTQNYASILWLTIRIYKTTTTLRFLAPNFFPKVERMRGADRHFWPPLAVL